MADTIYETGLGGRLGSATGSLLSRGLEALAESKINDLNAKKEIKALEAHGMRREDAERFIGLHPKLKEIGYKNFLNALGASPAQQTGMEGLQGLEPNQPQNPTQQNQLAQPQQQTSQQKSLADILKTPRATGKTDPLAQQKLELQQEKAKNQRLAQIERANKPYNDKIDKSRASAKEITALTNEALALLSTNKISTGFLGDIQERLGPSFQNKETQQFQTVINKLIPLLASEQGSGIVTNMKLKFEQASKALLSHNQETQKKALERVAKRASEHLKIADIRDQIIEENGGQIPNISTAVHKRYFSGKKSDNGLPEASKFEQGTIIQIDDGSYYQNKDNEWIPYSREGR